MDSVLDVWYRALSGLIDSSVCGLHGHPIAHRAIDNATFASHFTRTSSPNCLSLSLLPNLFLPLSRLLVWVVSPPLRVGLEHGHPGCGRTKTPSASSLCKVGRRPWRIDPPRGGSVLRSRSQRQCMLRCGRVGQKAFSVVCSGMFCPGGVGGELASVRSCPDPW